MLLVECWELDCKYCDEKGQCSHTQSEKDEECFFEGCYVPKEKKEKE